MLIFMFSVVILVVHDDVSDVHVVVDVVAYVVVLVATSVLVAAAQIC